MAKQLQNLNEIPFSMATVSIGTPTTPISQKLSALSAAHFTGIELGFPDLLNCASSNLSRDIAENDYHSLVQAAIFVRGLANAHGLRIMMLQPFANFEGWPMGSKERKEAFERAEGWISIMKACGTDMLQVGSTDSEEIGGRDDAVRDLKELGEMLKEEGFRLAYEPWCWATVNPTWKDCWEVVKEVNMENVGLCLDTFQIAGREYADPTTHSGIRKDASAKDLSERLAASLDELVRTVPKEKIFLLQVSDAWLPKTPIKDEVKDGLRPRAQWSHDFRPLPFESGYLPIKEVARKVLETGSRSWWSVEVFDGGAEGQEERETDLQRYGERAMVSVKRLLREAGGKAAW